MCTTLLCGSIKAQDNSTQLGNFKYKIAGAKGVCDSTVTDRWTNSKTWKFSSATVFSLNTAGYIGVYKSYDSTAAAPPAYDIIYNSNNRPVKGEYYVNYPGYGIIKAGYITVDTNSAGWTTEEHTYQINKGNDI